MSTKGLKIKNKAWNVRVADFQEISHPGRSHVQKSDQREPPTRPGHRSSKRVQPKAPDSAVSTAAQEKNMVWSENYWGHKDCYKSEYGREHQ